MNGKMYQKKKEKVYYLVYYIVYTVLFTFCFGFVVIIFDKNNASFIWELDGAPMLYPAFEYVGGFLRDFFHSFMNDVIVHIEQYDFTTGLGKNIIQYAGNWYFEPLSLLAVFIPKEHLVSAYNYFVVLRYYLCGISFSVFCFYKKEKYFSTLLGSMAYVFSFYTLFWGVRFPLFLVPMIYFPLLLVGMDKQLKENRSTFLIGIIFLSAWTHYYYFVINTAFLGIYFITECVGNLKSYKSIKDAFLVAVRKGLGVLKAYMIGCSMAAVIFIPNIYVFLHANRKGGGLNIPNLWWYGKAYYRKLWCYISAPFEEFSIGYEAVLGLLPLSLIGVLLLIGDRKEKNIIRYLVMGIICLLFPVCSYVLCGCSNVNNRWIYGFVFLTSYGLCRCFSDIKSISLKQRTYIFMYISIYGISIYTVCKSLQSEYVFAYIALFLVSFFCVLVMHKIQMVLSRIIIVLTLCIQIITWEYYLYSPTHFNYVYQFMDERIVCEKICDLAAGLIALENDDAFYRTDIIEAQRSNLASSVLTGYYGISDYSNVMCDDTYQYLLSVENCGLQENIMNYDLDGRTYLLAQNSVKYIVCSESMESYLPYGYAIYKKGISQSGIPITTFRNEFALPLAYTYDTYVLESECSESSPIERQDIYLNTLVLEQDIENIEKISISELEKHTADLSYQIVNMNNIEKNDNVYTVKDGGGDIVIEYNGIKNAETYIRLINLNISDNDFLDWTWFIDNGSGNSKSIFIMSDYNYYRPDTHNYLINLGYAFDSSGRCIIHIPCKGEFTLDEIELLAQDFDDYEQKIAERKECVLENIDVNGDFIAGDITLDKNKLLFLSIPYDTGWSVKLDGIKTKLVRANKGYMALQLPAGEHHIEMKYMIPGIRAGMVLSIFGWIFYFVDFLVMHFARRRK